MIASFTDSATAVNLASDPSCPRAIGGPYRSPGLLAALHLGHVAVGVLDALQVLAPPEPALHRAPHRRQAARLPPPLPISPLQPPRVPPPRLVLASLSGR